MDKYIERIDYLLIKGQSTLNNIHEGDMMGDYVDHELFIGFRSSSLTFIHDFLGEGHTYFKQFEHSVKEEYVSQIKAGIEILKVIKHDLESGYLKTLKALVSAEIFSDFMEMAHYLLKQDYKDASAVIIGSVLEEHLRQLCVQTGIATSVSKSGKLFFVKADKLNSDLAKEDVYNKLEMKSVVAWLDLRNNAAHGHFDKYDKMQVQNMYNGVLEFINRNQIK